MIKCTVGNKLCGKRCVPERYKCKDENHLKFIIAGGALIAAGTVVGGLWFLTNKKAPSVDYQDSSIEESIFKDIMSDAGAMNREELINIIEDESGVKGIDFDKFKDYVPNALYEELKDTNLKIYSIDFVNPSTKELIILATFHLATMSKKQKRDIGGVYIRGGAHTLILNKAHKDTPMTTVITHELIHAVQWNRSSFLYDDKKHMELLTSPKPNLYKEYYLKVFNYKKYRDRIRELFPNDEDFASELDKLARREAEAYSLQSKSNDVLKKILNN